MTSSSSSSAKRTRSTSELYKVFQDRIEPPIDLGVAPGPIGIDEHLLWCLHGQGKHIIVSGKAGSGKSHLLQRFVRTANSKHIRYALCAPTGIAAFNIGGETLHRRLGLGLAAGDPVSLFDQISKKKSNYRKTWKFLLKTDLLIIDEISMVHPDLFVKLDFLFKKARRSTRSFGGIMLLMVGDFTQLGPIISRDDSSGCRSVLDTDCWQSMTIARVALMRSYRQQDSEFLTLLNEVRMGCVSARSMELLQQRVGANVSVSSDDGATLRPIDIFPYNSNVDAHNNAQLTLLAESGAEVTTFAPTLAVVPSDPDVPMDADEERQARDMITKERLPQLIAQFPFFTIQLARGAQVMMRNNQFIDEGIYNGTMGTVTAVNSNTVYVRFVVNEKYQTEDHCIERAEFSIGVGKTVRIVMTQFPLTLAWASTIHKVQGLTLSSVSVDASNCFEAGQLYVAISRVRKLEDLRLIAFNARSLLTDERAVDFESLESHE